MKIDGGCHCGYLTYEAEIDETKISICHCTDCQALSGTAFRVSARSREDAFYPAHGRAQGIHQDRFERCTADPGFLPGMRVADLFDVGGRRTKAV